MNHFHIYDYWYFSFIRKYRFYFGVSGVLALICTIITFPGILYSDSYGRIDIANHLLDGVDHINSWNTTVPSIFIAISLLFTGKIVLYTFFHAWLLFVITFFLLISLGLKNQLLLLVLVGFNPMIWGASVYYETGVGCVTGIASIILLLSVLNIEKKELDRIIEFILLAFFAFIVFGYRANAFTIFPVFILYIIFSKWDRKLKLLGITAITSGCVMVSTFTTLANINTMSSKSAGFVWDMLCVMDSLDEDNKEELITIFDDIGGEGATIEALQMNTWNSIDGFIWHSRLNTTTLSRPGAFSKILKKYLYVIKSYPKQFMKVKKYSIFRTLGINQRIYFAEYDYNRWERMGQFDFWDTKIRHLFVDTYKYFCNTFGGYILRPIVVFLIAFVFVIFEVNKKNKNRKLLLLTFLLSVFYYGSFLINTQAYQIRYFYPSLYLLTTINISATSDLIETLRKPLRKD